MIQTYILRAVQYSIDIMHGDLRGSPWSLDRDSPVLRHTVTCIVMERFQNLASEEKFAYWKLIFKFVFLYLPVEPFQNFKKEMHTEVMLLHIT